MASIQPTGDQRIHPQPSGIPLLEQEPAWQPARTEAVERGRSFLSRLKSVVSCGSAGMGGCASRAVRSRTLVPTRWVGNGPASGLQMIEVTPLDLVPVVFNTVVAVACVLHEHTPVVQPAAIVSCMQQAVQHVQAMYPLIAGRLMPMGKARKAVGLPACQAAEGQLRKSKASPTASHALVFPRPCTISSPSLASHGTVVATEKKAQHQPYGVPVVAVHVAGMDWAAVKAHAVGRRGYSYTAGCDAALPPYLQAMDVAALHRGKEPLLRLQLTWLEGGGVLLGLTASHILADAATFSTLIQELLSSYHSALTQLPCPDTNGFQVLAGLPAPLYQGTGMPAVTNGTGGAPQLVRVSRRVTANIRVHTTAEDPALSVATAATHSSPATTNSRVSSPAFIDNADRFNRSYLYPSAVCTSPHTSHGNRAAGADCAAADGDESLGPLRSAFIQLRPTGCGELLRGASALADTLLADVKMLGASAVAAGPVTLVLHIRQADLQALKAACQHAIGRRHPMLSAHDVTTSVLWLLCTSVRGRPLPGQPLDAKFAAKSAFGQQLQQRMFGVTLDLRQNCKPHLVPPGHLGNASASLHIRGGHTSMAQGDTALAAAASLAKAAPWPCAWSPGAAATATYDWVSQLAEHSPQAAGPHLTLVRLVAAAALRVRSTVNTFRCTPEAGAATVAEFAAHAGASALTNACVLTRYISQFDGFLTTWAAFPLHATPLLLNDAPPAAAAGTPGAAAEAAIIPRSSSKAAADAPSAALLQPIIHSLAPWTAIAIPAPATATAQAAPAVAPAAPAPTAAVTPAAAAAAAATATAAPAAGVFSQGVPTPAGTPGSCPHHHKPGSDGLLLWFTVPAAAEQKLRGSCLLPALLPNSRWLGT